jgi:hypothetical protein
MKLAAILLVLLTTAALTPVAGAAGPPSQRDATLQACFARADVASEANGFKNFVIAPGTPADVRLSLRTMGMDLSKIRGALPGLSPALRRQVTVATLQFAGLVGRLAPNLLAAPATKALPRRFQRFTAAAGLVPVAYQRTLGMVACP